MNYQVLENNHLQTSFGVLGAVTSFSCYETGELKGVKLGDKNMVLTHAGELIPFYTETPRRKNKESLTFHKNGLIKAIALEEQQEIMTPIGEFPAELVTFYESGELSRFFPLDGQISGFWSEKDEKELNIPFSFEFEFGAFTASLVGISFYKSGDIKSITLFPGEIININSPAGNINAKTGFSLYENGGIKNIEPATPSPVKTPIGVLTAFDTQAVGISADDCSLKFDEDGRIISLINISDTIFVQSENGELQRFKPKKVINPLDGESEMTIGLKISFNYTDDSFTISDDNDNIFSISNSRVNILSDVSSFGCNPSDCAGCSGCSH